MIMSSKSQSSNNNNKYESEIRRGPWTCEEDNLLAHYINSHGEGRWNSLANFAGLKRTGKSCRLRWLNYLKPDIKRGNLTPQEQILILELHSKWGNKWSKIAQHLPGRTDNEIKNYWRTRVQKQARQLNIDSNSAKFTEALRAVWMPRLIERVEQDSPLTSSSSSSSIETRKLDSDPSLPKQAPVPTPCPHPGTNPDNNSSANSIQFENSIDDNCNDHNNFNSNNYYHYAGEDIFMSERHVEDVDWLGEDLGLWSSCWNTDELWQFRKQEKFGV